MEKSRTIALEKFISRLKKRLKEKLVAVYHFGSTAKGTSAPDSDIDVLVVFKDTKESEVLDLVAEISFAISCEYGETIETVLMSEKEFKKDIGHSPFLWEAVEHGRALFTQATSTEWALDFRDHLELSSEYLGYAKDALQENKFRLAIDTAYNAAELLTKALILSMGSTLASSHGGVVGQFGKIFVLSELVERDVGKNLQQSTRPAGKSQI
ncbi:MAG: nucleotidyltransferase domain-containing protein [bacterium]